MIPERTVVQTEEPGTLSTRIARWAIVTPDAPAVEYHGTVLRYCDLLRRVTHLAAWMQHRGVLRGDIVALNCKRSAEQVIGMLAAWRIGAAFLPLDPSWPATRQQRILDESKPTLILRGGGCASLGRDELDLQEADFDPLPVTLDTIVTSPYDLAYVIYTSGSTGMPKGVMIEHAQLFNYVEAVSSALALHEIKRWGLLGTLAADLGYTALFGGLFNGACIVIADDGEARDADSFERFMRDKRIEGLKIVPSHLDALLESERPVLPRKLIFGGEAAALQLVERVSALAPDCRIFNHYGPTETTVGVMVHTVDVTRDRGSVLPLTTVLSNCSVHVLDDELHAVPMGALGQVYIGGAQLCRGYFGGRNSEAFVCDDRLGTERFYRTGDLAYRLENGAIRLAGRADDQLKINGYRVEPAEIEAALLGLPDVRQVAVIARSTEGAGTELVAFVVIERGSDEQAARQRLRQALTATLPVYMQPAFYVFLDQLPRLANGKIDRRELQSVDVTVPTPGAVGAPDGSIETLVMRLMAELLKRPSLGVQDDFFEHGGHSLLAIKLAARIRRQLGVEISAATVFDYRTAATLAEVLQPMLLSRQAELSA